MGRLSEREGRVVSSAPFFAHDLVRKPVPTFRDHALPIPKISRKLRWPLAVIATARVPSMCLIQPAVKQCRHSAPPTTPARCGRRSLQSRHGRHSMRLLRLAPASRSMPRRSNRAAPRVGDDAGIGRQFDLAVGDQRIRQRDAEMAGEMVVTGARGAQRQIARPDEEPSCARGVAAATCMMLSSMRATAGEASR